MKKNDHIQFWRIIFTYIIAFYHLNKKYGIKTSGYIAVEFFFMVSGYLLLSKYEKGANDTRQQSFLEYTWHRYKSYFPYTCFAFFVAFSAVGFYRHFSFEEYFRELFAHLPELFLINLLGFKNGGGISFNDVTWYVSALLICGALIWGTLQLNKKLFIKSAPFISFLLYACIFINFKSVCCHSEYLFGFISAGILRGLAGMTLGISAYSVATRLRQHGFRFAGVLSAVLFILAGIVLPFYIYRSFSEVIMILMLFGGICLAFSCNDKTLLSDRVIEQIVSVSIMIYLNHEVVKEVICMVWKTPSMISYLAYFIVITVYSFISYHLITRCLAFLKEKSIIVRK